MIADAGIFARPLAESPLPTSCTKTSSYYEQTDGTAIGSPVSPVVASIFMEHIEKQALASSPYPIRFYVDDAFCFLQKSSVEEVHKHLNSVSPAIQFTVEQEAERQFPFLDVLVMRDENGS